MSFMKWEVEKKFPLENVATVKARLLELGARFSDPIQQSDRYFSHPVRDFHKTDEALRLRQVGENNFVTYKGPKIDSDTKTRHELELPLSSGPQIAEQFVELFNALGFREVATVQKTRRPGELTWDGHPVELALDEVKGLGSFLELEIPANDQTLEAAKTAINTLSQQLGLGASERRSYLELLMEHEF
jgi:adenylate cyclase, class 2